MGKYLGNTPVTFLLLAQCYLLATCLLLYLLVTCLLLGVASRREALLNLTLLWCVEHVSMCLKRMDARIIFLRSSLSAGLVSH